MDHVVVDVEIIREVDATSGGWDATDKLGVAVACVWEYNNQRMRVYGPDDVVSLRDRLLEATRITGYNIWNFDFPVIWGISKPDWLNAKTEASNPWRAEAREDIPSLKAYLKQRCNDILRRIWIAQGFNPDVWNKGMGGSKLDDIAGATIGARKIGEGVMAPKWYQAGQVQRVVNYCADDVAIERDLSDFIDRYGYVIHNGKQLFLKEPDGRER